jgi:hypothetical protein
LSIILVCYEAGNTFVFVGGGNSEL